MGSPSDDELVAGLLAGRQRCARDLYLRFGGPLLRYALTLTGRLPEAEDLHQETFVQAFSRLHQYRGPQAFKRWLFGICRHRFLNDRRRKEVATKPLGPVEEQRLADPEGQKGLRNVVEQGGALGPLLSALPSDTREVLLLRLVEHLSYGEIATMTGYREDNLRQMVSRGLMRMRKELGTDVLLEI